MPKINPVNHLEIAMMPKQTEAAWLLTASRRLLKIVQTRTNRLNNKLSFLVVDSFQVAFQDIKPNHQFKRGRIA